MNYLLQEISFVLSSANIFNTDKTAYIYQKRRETFKNLLSMAHMTVLKEKIADFY
jgi:hypothetical protein